MPKAQSFLAFTKRFSDLKKNRTRGPGVQTTARPRDGSGASNPRLTVLVRKRPLNKKEQEGKEKDVVACEQNEAIVREPKLKVDLTKYTEEHHFLFDRTFDEFHTNEDLYTSSVKPLVEAAFNGARCTCFAYGQTGSGKTYTMMGPGQRSVDVDGKRFYDEDGARAEDSAPIPKGIFLLAAEDFFDMLRGREQNLGVIISFYEIYCGKLFDLLNRRQLLHARENAKNKVCIVGLTETQVSNVEEVMHVIEFGLQARTTGVTGANIDSSRSHAILQITLKDITQESQPIHGQVSFIDLAGSERGANTLDQDRQTRLDGAEINKSLLALKECIRALDQQLEHTPFRGSKLTQVLKDSFVGEYCRTVMIATVSPTASTVEHTLNTLRYAYRVKELQDRSSIPEMPKRHYSPPARLVDDMKEPVPGNKDSGPSRIPGSASTSRSYTDDNPRDSRSSASTAEGATSASSSSSSSSASIAPAPRDLTIGGSSSSRITGSSVMSGSSSSSSSSSSALADIGGPSSNSTGSSSASSSSGAAVGGSSSSSSATPTASGSGTTKRSARPRKERDSPSQKTPRRGKSPIKKSSTTSSSSMADNPARASSATAPAVSTTAGESDATSGMGRAGSQPDDQYPELRDLVKRHDQLISLILQEEEDLIASHRQHIDQMVDLVKEEMKYINHVDRPGSDVDAYVAGLDHILNLKTQYVQEIRGKVNRFQEHLREEDVLSKKFQARKMELNQSSAR